MTIGAGRRMQRILDVVRACGGARSLRVAATVLAGCLAVRLSTAGTDAPTGGARRDPVPPARTALGPSTQASDQTSGCALWQEDLRAPIVPLTAEMTDSLGRAFSGFNQMLLARLDSLLRAGTYGPAASREARSSVHLLARMLAVNSLHYMVRFATDPEHVYEASEATLRDAFRRYADPGLYPIARMRRGRMGLGHICVQYDVSTDLDSTVSVGGQTFRIRVEQTPLPSGPQRVLILELPTILFSVVELIIAEHWTSQVEFVRSKGPPAPYDLYLFHDIDGMYIRKWGTHKPTALMFWCTPRDVNRTQLPRTPLVGNCIYVPRLALELPAFLPDLGFDDLRKVDLPGPILSLTYIQERRYPDWMQHAEPRGFKDWDSYGPIPPDLRLRFPDL